MKFANNIEATIGSFGPAESSTVKQSRNIGTCVNTRPFYQLANLLNSVSVSYLDWFEFQTPPCKPSAIEYVHYGRGASESRPSRKKGNGRRIETLYYRNARGNDRLLECEERQLADHATLSSALLHSPGIILSLCPARMPYRCDYLITP